MRPFLCNGRRPWACSHQAAHGTGLAADALPPGRPLGEPAAGVWKWGAFLRCRHGGPMPSVLGSPVNWPFLGAGSALTGAAAGAAAGEGSEWQQNAQRFAW